MELPIWFENNGTKWMVAVVFPMQAIFYFDAIVLNAVASKKKKKYCLKTLYDTERGINLKFLMAVIFKIKI